MKCDSKSLKSAMVFARMKRWIGETSMTIEKTGMTAR